MKKFSSSKEKHYVTPRKTGTMKIHRILLIFISFVALFSIVIKTQPVYSKDYKNECKKCHSDMFRMLEKGEHSFFNCSDCHGKSNRELITHIKSPSKARPLVRPLDEGPSFCGKCHQKEYNEYTYVNLKSIPKIEKASPKGRAPAFDLLLYKYGFVYEHSEPRSHIFMLLDHVIVDRGYKARFRLKDYRNFIPPDGWDGNINDLIIDTAKEGSPWKSKSDTRNIEPYAFGAGNRTCLKCKTTDYSVGWETISKGGNKTGFGRYIRAGNKQTTEDIASGVVKFSLNCTQCHDPHLTKMRVIRDALIEALKERGPYPYNQEKNIDAKEKLTLVGFPRAKKNYREMYVWDKKERDLNWLTCAQCHVEYECNPVKDFKTDKKIGFDDPRTNVFPWRNNIDTYKYYTEELGIYTFPHGITKAKLIKVQHPETEVWWESKHEKAGVSCIDCHMPDDFHSPMGPKSIGVEKTCLKCHREWDKEEALYVIEGIQEYTRGKMRDAEFHLSRLVNTIALAEEMGMDKVVIKKARELHSRSHLLWEWWTAENSDGFHDPDEAFITLGEASRLAEKGWKMLETEMKK